MGDKPDLIVANKVANNTMDVGCLTYTWVSAPTTVGHQQA